jgi:hypothetical protein
MHIIRYRERPDPGFNPTSKTTCFKCMERGDRFVYIDGRRMYACKTHFHVWEQECMKSERHRDRVFGDE